ncbi:sarcoplasmic/endoplasmic reticulum calcium ATPase regulator DWORF isoform X1 [Phyllostomus hastatus]|uniref:sarcoplasmic/endoplasmic reticulum calcium ATPase regulator DWORF isoform X1 n=1 Tax=Phyllostomus hastatus TaxID=9423 RepID=UPI001E67E661|nr:sarcoplasmic/endoplasmic reticulum calcium ATPase regulator DWORF isoform X1 [Phyllostomus hastatus]
MDCGLHHNGLCCLLLESSLWGVTGSRSYRYSMGSELQHLRGPGERRGKLVGEKPLIWKQMPRLKQKAATHLEQDFGL